MAEITSKDFQELIKRQKETTDRLETIVDQNIRAGDASERFKDALPEILSDTRLASQREKFDKKEGITETDNLQKETTEEVQKGNEILLAGIQNANDREKVEEEYEKAHLDVNTKVNEGIISVAEGQRLNQKLGEERDEKLKGLIQPLQESKEDRNDFKRTMKKITGFMGSVKNFVGKTFGLLDTATMGTLSTVGGILKGLFKGGLLFGALVLLQKFIDSPAFESMIEIINNVEKAVRAYIKSFEGLTFEEGVTKLKKDIAGVVKNFVKSFATELAIGAAVLAGALGLFFLGIRGILKLALLPFSAAAAAGSLLFGGGKGKGKMPKGGVTEKSAKSGKGAFKMGEMNPQTAKKMQTLTKFGKVGIVGSAITGGLALAPDIMTLTDDEASAVEKSEAKKGIAKTSTGLGVATAGAAAGSKLGAGIGTLIAPGLGTVAGGLLGGMVGGTAGFVAGTGLFDAVSEFFGKKADDIPNQAIKESNDKIFNENLDAQRKLDELLEAGKISQEEYNERAEKNRLKALEETKKNNKHLEMQQKNTLKQVTKSNEMIALLEENNKLLTSIKDSSPTFFNANNTNVQNNPSEQTIVMDSQIVDGFHSQVMRNQYG